MKTWACLLALLALPALPACGDDDSEPTIDAGPDAAAVATSNTAKGALAGAATMASWELDGEQLLSVDGEYLINGGGEVDPAQYTSFWKYTFLEAGTGDALYVLWMHGTYNRSAGTINPEGVKFIAGEWPDSDGLVTILTSAGYVAPTAGEKVTAKLFMYSSADAEDTLNQCPNPVWELQKIDPGPPVVSDVWWYLNCPDQMGSAAVCHGPSAHALECAAAP